MQLILVSPILPGRTEACRRFVQEMTDGRGEQYAASRAAMGVHEERIWIHKTATAATVIVLMETDSPPDALHTLATSSYPSTAGTGRRFWRSQAVIWLMKATS